MGKTHCDEIIRNLLQKRLVFIEDETIHCWIDYFPEKGNKEKEISDDKISFEDLQFEDAPQSTQSD